MPWSTPVSTITAGLTVRAIAYQAARLPIFAVGAVRCRWGWVVHSPSIWRRKASSLSISSKYLLISAYSRLRMLARLAAIVILHRLVRSYVKFESSGEVLIHRSHLETTGQM